MSVFPKRYQGGPGGAMWVSAGDGLWKLTSEGADKIMHQERFGKFFRSNSDELRWVEDMAGHSSLTFL